MKATIAALAIAFGASSAGAALFSPANMTADNAPSPYVASASQTRSGYHPYFAFSPFGLSGFNPWVTDTVASPGTPAYLEIDIGAAWVLSSYAFGSVQGASAVYMVSEWLLQGSNDGSAWTTLDSRTAQTGWGDFEIRTYTPAPITAAYRYYRGYFTGNNGSGSNTAIGQVYLYGTPAPAASATAKAFVD